MLSADNLTQEAKKEFQSSHSLQIWIILLQLFDSDSNFFQSANRKVW